MRSSPRVEYLAQAALALIVPFGRPAPGDVPKRLPRQRAPRVDPVDGVIVRGAGEPNLVVVGRIEPRHPEELPVLLVEPLE